MPNKKYSRVFSKVVSSFVVITTILWSVGIPIGFLVPVAKAGHTGPHATATGGPQNGQMGIPLDALIDRQFDQNLAAGTVTTTNVKLEVNSPNAQTGTPGGSNLCTTVQLENNNRVKCNHSALTISTWYTFTVTTGVTDGTNPIDGNPDITGAQNFTAAFQTSSFGGGTNFNPPPHIGFTNPTNGGGTLPTNGKISIKFDVHGDMKTSGEGSVLDFTNNLQLFALSNFAPTGSNLFSGSTTGSYDGTTEVLTITPPVLTANTFYRLIIKGDNNQNFSDGSCGGTGEPGCVMSVDNLAMPGPDVFIDFKAVAADSTVPAVVGSFPNTGATGVDRAIFDLSISFNKPLDSSTVSTSTIKLFCNDTNSNASDGCPEDIATDAIQDGNDPEITGTTLVLDDDGRVVHLSPNAILQANGNYLIVVKSGGSGAKDVTGNALLADIVRTFKTGSNINGAGSDTTAPTVLFADADNFGVFITFSEPLKFNATSNTTESSSSGTNDVNNLSNWTLETSFDGTNFTQAPLTGKKVKYEPDTKTLIVRELSLPPQNQFKVTGSTSIQDLAGNALATNARTAQGTVKSSQQTGGNLGPGGTTGQVDFFTMGTNSIMAFPKSGLAGKTTRYHVEFSADTAIPASGKITLAYPSGFNFDTTNSDATKRCTTLPTDNFENSDLNGPATGTVTAASVACDSVSRAITLTLGSVGTQAGDRMRFEVQGVVNSTMPKDFSTSGYTVDIKTYNASNTLLNSKTSMPFFISVPGSRTVAGKVFVDADNDGVFDAGETGAQNIKVCLGGPMGFDCTSTDASGDYSFASLSDGFYHIDIPPMTSGSFTGGPFFKDVNVSGTNVSNVNFPLKSVSAQDILDVYISGGTGLASQKLDVFAFSTSGATPTAVSSGSGPGPGGFAVRELTLDSNGVGATTLPLSQGRWQVGVGPAMPKEPGASFAPPDFTFMPPRPQEVTVGTGGVPDLCTTGAGASSAELCFNLSASSNQIKGKIVDGSGTAVTNVFVMARPTFFEATGPGGGGGGMGQSDSNGLFNLKVVNGTYIVEAFMPGMPPANPMECTVKENTGLSDNNSTADVYCAGTLIANDIAGFSGASITIGNITTNDLVLMLAKGDTSVSGRVLDDSGSAISFAHVQAMEVDSNGNPFGGWRDAPTDNSGNYTLYVIGGTQASPKSWKIKAFAPGFGELPSLTVAVVSGDKLTGKNLQAASGDFVTVSGTVYADANSNSSPDSGEGVQGAFVGIHGSGGGNGTVTGSDGTYSVKVRSGTGYTIEGFVPGQGPTQALANQTLTSDATGKNLKIAKPGTLVVYVCTLTNATGAPSATNGCASNQVTTAFVDVRDSTGKGHGSSSNATAGRYENIASAGTYTVRVHDPAAGHIGSQDNVVIAANGTTYINIQPAQRFQVSGTVSSLNSACVDGTTVFLSDATNGRVTLAKASAAGAWSTNVPNGTYSVGAARPGCVDSADPGLVTVSSAAVNQTGDTDLARTLTSADATVTGRVTLSGSNVSFDTMIFATSGTGKKVVDKVDISQTGTSNNYSIRLTAGTWTLQARSDGSESSAASVTVASGGSATQNITLAAISGYTRKEPKPYNMTPSRGGLVKNSDIHSDFEVNVPAGALGTSSNAGSVSTKETTAVADTLSQDVLGNKGVEITPKDSSGQPITTTSSEVTVTIPYTEADVTAAGSSESKLVIGSWSEEKQQWETLATTCDTTANKCTAATTHFSTFGIIAPVGGGASPSAPSSGTGGGGVPPSSLTQAQSQQQLQQPQAQPKLVAERPVSQMTVAELLGKIAEIQSQVVKLQAQLKVLRGEIKEVKEYLGVPKGFAFGQILREERGKISDEVRYLQTILKSEGAFPTDIDATGRFGPITKAAVKAFQEKYRSEILDPLGIKEGTGMVGSATRAKLNQLLKGM